MSDNTNNKSDWQERELGALWKQAGRSQNYLSGHVTVDGKQQKVVVFANKNKKDNERAPDYRVYKSQPKAEAEAQTTEAAQEEDIL
mgnify:FL=1|tara:strand:- start:7010 stop:7267 length:258 start_codon:yes stop_codon:yes gene_type:complete